MDLNGMQSYQIARFMGVFLPRGREWGQRVNQKMLKLSEEWYELLFGDR